MKLKKSALIILAVATVAFLGDLGTGAAWWWKFNQAKAVSACPISEGGKVVKYIPKCVMTSGQCSCSVLYNTTGMCVGYDELQVVGQNETVVIGVLPTTEIVGGPIPKPSDDFLGCLVSNISPLVIGLPSASAKRAQKIANILENIWNKIT